MTKYLWIAEKKTLAEAVQMVVDSEITQGPSCILILKSQLFLARQAR